MSSATKKKYVRAEVENDFSLPENNQTIVRICRNAGNHLHEVETASGKIFLASLLKKFWDTCFIKRGDFVLTEPILEGKKVKGEIVRILWADQIKEFVSAGVWPEEFKDLIKQKYKIGIEKDSYYHAGQQKVAKCERDLLSEGDCNFESEEDSDDDIPANPNHVQEYDESEESSSEEEED